VCAAVGGEVKSVEGAIGKAAAAVEKNIEKAEKDVPQRITGAKKFGSGAPDLSSRFQSGGTGGRGPAAGKPAGVSVIN
jgi:hypothetical protein